MTILLHGMLKTQNTFTISICNREGKLEEAHTVGGFDASCPNIILPSFFTKVFGIYGCKEAAFESA